MVLDNQKPLIFRSLFRRFSCFFKTAPRDRFYRVPGSNFYKKLVFDAMFDFRGFQKGTLWTTFSPKWTKKKKYPSDPGGPSRDPAFHETTVILMPLGPSVFLNIIFSIEIGYFSVFAAFLCAMLYMPFLFYLLIKPQ